MNDAEKRAVLEHVATDELQKLDVPGAAIAVVYEDEPVFSRGFGVASSETGAALTQETLLRIGSLTKVITAYTLISLAQEQRLSVHTPIAMYVADLPTQVGRLSIHQLLCHTAGLKDDFSHYGPHDEIALGRAVRSYGDEHFFSEPGQIFSYSALGYAVAGVVIEALSRRPYAQAVQERMLTPLKMERSTFYPTMAMTYPLSQGHEISGPRQWSVVRPYDDTAERWPSGFLFANVIELTRFARAFMQRGEIDGEQVLAAEVIEILTQPHAKPLETSSDGYYGYGLFLSENRGMRQFALGGGRRGFSSHMRMISHHRFAVIQLLNRAGGIQLNKTSARAMELFLPLAQQRTSSSPAQLPLSAAEISRLSGRYARPDIHATDADVLQLVDNEGKLMFRFGDKDQLIPVTKTGEERFALQTGSHAPPFIFAFRKGTKASDDYLCCNHRAYKRLM